MSGIRVFECASGWRQEYLGERAGAHAYALSTAIMCVTFGVPSS